MKIFFRSLVGIIVLVLIGLVVTFFIVRSGLSANMARKMQSQLGVPVTVGSVQIGYSAVEIDKLTIGNPNGSILPKALSTNNIAITTPVTQYFKRDIVIEEITVSDIYLGLEFDSPSGTSGNWTQIMNNYENAPQPASESTRTVHIKRLVLNNISVDVVYRSNGKKIKRLRTIPQIVLTDISSTGGVPMHQIMESVLGQMLESVFMKENLKNMLNDIIKNPPKTAQDLLKLPFKGLFK
jgi:hypothetical protein